MTTKRPTLQQRAAVLRAHLARERQDALKRSCVPYGLTTVRDVPDDLLPDTGRTTWVGDDEDGRFFLEGWAAAGGYLVHQLLPASEQGARRHGSLVRLGERDRVKPPKTYSDLAPRSGKPQRKRARQLASGYARLAEMTEQPRWGSVEVRLPDGRILALPAMPDPRPQARPESCEPSPPCDTDSHGRSWDRWIHLVADAEAPCGPATYLTRTDPYAPWVERDRQTGDPIDD